MDVYQARASRPGELQVELLHHCRCFPRFTLICSLLLLGFGWLAIQGHPVAWVPVVLVAALMWLAVKRAQSQFQRGDLNPGKVVSVSPYRVAVFADMRYGGPSYPAIKVLPQPLEKQPGAPPKLGEYVAVVATYHPPTDNGHWNDISPVAVQCATSSVAEIRRALGRLDQGDWRDLEEGLSQLANPAAPGLYPVQIHWRDAALAAAHAELDEEWPADEDA